MSKVKNSNVYIPSIEACDIWSHNYRDKRFHSFDYNGMIPNSLLLMKLRSIKGENKFEENIKGKRNLSNDIINVKFGQKVRSGKEILKSIPGILKGNKSEISTIDDELLKVSDDEKIKLHKAKAKLESSSKYFEELKVTLEKSGVDDKWRGSNTTSLRSELYKDGFTLRQIDFETGEIVLDTKYVFFGRSSSKSRKGECWFIKESLHNVMDSWSKMNLKFKTDEIIDLAGMMSYQFLVSSSIEDTIKIDPNSILMVDEVFSTFDEEVNYIEKNEEGNLISVPKLSEIRNNIFDGEALLDSGMFKENQSMILLRSHFFKAAAFSTNLQLFFKDYYGDDYETKYIDDMWGNSIKVTDIKMIINPTCLKALKYSSVIGTEKDMYNHWKQTVKHEEFGICKHEKPTKRGYEDGNPLQQTSYQMLNSTGATNQDILELAKYEHDYVMKLKSDDDFFIEHINKNANIMNANEMFSAVYDISNKIVRTKLFRTFRTKTIHNHVNHVKKGKIRLYGDYATLLSCPIEYLYKAVGEVGDEISSPMTLKDNEVYTTLFGDKGYDKEYAAFRSPHTSMSNILLIKNTYNADIAKYFKLTPNIVVINTIGTPILDILSGADMDSDSVAIFNNETMTKLAKNCYGKYRVCVNGIKPDNTEYTLSLADMAKIDGKLSVSTKQIGMVTNNAQIALSLYWDNKNKGMDIESEEMISLLDNISKFSILSGIAIDGAKRQYGVNIDAEIKKIRKELALKKDEKGNLAKPNFWKYVYNDKHDKAEDASEGIKRTHYYCPMDYLYDAMKVEKGKDKQPLSLSNLLLTKDKNKGNRRQIPAVKELAANLQSEIGGIKTKGGDEDEMIINLENVTDKYITEFRKVKVNTNTMYALLSAISDESESNIKNAKKKSLLRLLNQLYQTQTPVFLDSFK